jgi:hypothetical protein
MEDQGENGEIREQIRESPMAASMANTMAD